MAFNQADGKVVWARHDFGNVYSSPILIDVAGLEQVVVLMDGALVGSIRYNGDLQWQVPFKADYSIAIATPLWGPGNLLFVSSEDNAGAKVIELHRQGQQIVPKELWSSNRLRLHHGNAMRIDDTLYFTSGGKGSPAILTAADVRTGEVRWQERSIGKATFVWADGKLVTLDQSGTLMIAHPSPQGFKITATCAAAQQSCVDTTDPRRHARLSTRQTRHDGAWIWDKGQSTLPGLPGFIQPRFHFLCRLEVNLVGLRNETEVDSTRTSRQPDASAIGDELRPCGRAARGRLRPAGQSPAAAWRRRRPEPTTLVSRNSDRSWTITPASDAINSGSAHRLRRIRPRHPAAPPQTAMAVSATAQAGRAT